MRISLKFFALILMVIGGMIGFNPAAGAAGNRPDWSGLYDILITTSNGQQIPAEINIKTLGNQVEMSGDFKQYPLNIVGDYSGDVEGEGIKAHFDINEFGLVKGPADFVIRRVEAQYQIKGQAAVSYSYMTKSGQLTADFSGQRREAAPIPSPTPAPQDSFGQETTGGHNYTTIIAIIVGLILLAIMFSSGSKRRRR